MAKHFNYLALAGFFKNNRKKTKGRTQQRIPIMVDMPYRGGTIRVPTGQFRLIRHQTNYNKTFPSAPSVNPDRDKLDWEK